MSYLRCLLLCFVFSIVNQLVQAEDFKKEIVFQKTNLYLNGHGTRIYKSIFGSKDIYKAALYLEDRQISKEQKDKKIINSDKAKIVEMIYQYAIESKDAKKAWEKSLNKNCAESCKVITKEKKAFLKSIKSVKPGTHRLYAFIKQEVFVYEKNQQLFNVKNKEFAKVLLSTWIGDYPPTEELKQGLLGRD